MSASGLARDIAGRTVTLRVIELSGECCAVAYSVRGRVLWVKRSATFPDWIPKSRKVVPMSAAAEHVIRADAWVPRTRIDAASVKIVEQSAVILEPGAVFTMQWLPKREMCT